MKNAKKLMSALLIAMLAFQQMPIKSVAAEDILPEGEQVQNAAEEPAVEETPEVTETPEETATEETEVVPAETVEEVASFEAEPVEETPAEEEIPAEEAEPEETAEEIPAEAPAFEEAPTEEEILAEEAEPEETAEEIPAEAPVVEEAPAAEEEIPAEEAETEVTVEEPAEEITVEEPEEETVEPEETVEETEEETVEETEEETEEEVTEETADPEETEEEVNMPAQGFKAESQTAVISAWVDEGVFPENITLRVRDLSKAAALGYGEYVNLEGREVVDAAAFDITFVDDNRQPVQPKDGQGVHVNITLKNALEGTEFTLLHDHDGTVETLTGEDVSVTANDASFVSGSFSIYAVVGTGETGEDARLTVNFVQADGTVVPMQITQAQIDHIETYIYDPSFGSLPAGAEGALIKGWTDVEEYTDTTPVKTIVGIRTEVTNKLNAGIAEGDEITYYAMVFESYTVTFLDEEGVTIRNDQKLYRIGSEASHTYTVDYPYTPYVRPEDEEAGITAQFAGWQQLIPQVAGEEVIYQNGETFTLAEDRTLRATVRKGYWLSFNENLTGATYTQPQLVSAGAHPTEPTPPTAGGYTFEGWYTEDASASDRDGQVAGDLVDFATMTLTANTTVHAKWTEKADTSFTVLVWSENLDGGNDFVKSFTFENAVTGSNMADVLEATVGDSTVYVDGEPVFIGLLDNPSTANQGFTYSNYTTNNDGKVVSAGTSVLNVYFTRREYTLKFYYARSQTQGGTTRYQVSQNYDEPTAHGNNGASTQGTWVPTGNQRPTTAPGTTFGGAGTETRGNYTYYYRTLTAKYGQSISAEWPTYDQFSTFGNYRLGSWAIMHTSQAYIRDGQGTIKGKITVMDEQILGNLGSADGNHVYANYDTASSQYDWVYNIYFGDENGENYTLHESVSARSHDSGSNWQTQQHGPSYPGMELDHKERVGNRLEINYYYNPLPYSILFMDGIYQVGTGASATIKYDKHTDALGEVNNIAYGSNVSSYKDYKDTNLQKEMQNYIFLGWYADAACTELYNFTTMPEGGITVYAKWLKKEYEVNLHPNDDAADPIKYSSTSQAEQFWVENGEQVGNVGGERIYYDLVGWFADEKFTKNYDFDLFVLNDVVISTLGRLYTEEEIDPEYPNTVGVLDLYAKWRSRLIGSKGIVLEYDATSEGTGAPTDDNNYVDLAEAIAGSAATSTNPDKVFSHWEIQKWNGTAFEDVGQSVYPGDTFEVRVDYARITDDNDGDKVVTKDELDTNGSYTYTVQLKAVYLEKEKPIDTFINWYNNYDGSLIETSTGLAINEAVAVPAAPTRDGYKFLGWIRGVEEVCATTPSTGMTTLTELYITYTEGNTPPYDSEYVAADELLVNDQGERGTGAGYEYHHAMFAKWEPITYTVHFDKNAADAVGTMDDQEFEYDEEKALTAIAFTYDGFTFQGWSTDASATSPEYTDAQVVKNLTTEDGATVTLYAIWLPSEIEVDTTDATTRFATKTVEGEGFTTTPFIFELEPVDGAPAPTTTTATLEMDAAGSEAINFGTVTLGEGTYTYTVKETNAAADGWTFDTEEKTVTVTVAPGASGALEATVQGVTITNKYEAEPVVVDTDDETAGTVFATKTVTGEGFKETTFEFTIEEVGESPVPVARTATLPMSAAGSAPVNFGEITFTEAGTYTYLIAETNTAADGWTFDTADKTVIVTVEDDGEGHLTATVEGVTITNSYTAEPVVVDTDDETAGTVFATKTVEGEGFKETTFSFTIAAGEGAPAPAVESATLPMSAAGSAPVNFGEITFTEAGTYTYTVTETNTAADGWTFDTAAKTVTVTVEDDGEGHLTATVDGATITNSYEAEPVVVDTDDETAGTVFATKTVEGEGFKETTFSFTIAAGEGAPAPAVESATLPMRAAGSAPVNFGEIEFTKAGTYEYTVTETNTAADGWTFDTAAKTVIVTVEDDGEGHLTATVEGVTITNSYEAAPVEVDTDDETAGTVFAKKTVEGEGFKETTFEFSIEAAEGSPAPAVTSGTATLSAAGSKNVDFGTITFTEAGAYTYTVTEISQATDGWTYDNSPKTVTVDVTDDGEGHLEADVTSVEIINTYKPEPVIVDTDDEDAGTVFATKTVEGEDFEVTTFSFTIAAVGKAPAPEVTSGTATFSEAGSDAVNFGEIEFTEAGTFEYTVTETTKAADGWTFDTAAKTVTVDVTDDGEGHLEATVKGVEITNRYKLVPVVVDTDDETAGTVFATKTVEGEGFAATTFSFTIAAVGDAPTPASTTGTVTMSAAGSKAIDLGKITFTEAGTYEYTVAETNTAADGWTFDTAAKTVTVTVTSNNGKLEATVKGVEITNSYKAKPVDVDTKDDAAGTAFAKKTVTGSGFAATTFNFSITANGKAPKPAKATGSLNVTAAGTQTIDFGKITFTEPGTYTYTVKETNTAADNWTLDTANKTVTVKVTDNGKGQLEAKVTSATITNTYAAPAPVPPTPVPPGPGPDPIPEPEPVPVPPVPPVVPVPVGPVPVVPAPEPEPVVEPTPTPAPTPSAAPAATPTPEIIDNPEPPLAAPDRAWALINLLSTIGTVLVGAGMLVTFLRKKKEDEEEEEEGTTRTKTPEEEEEEEDENKRRKSKLLGLIPAVASVITFILTEDMRTPMRLVDKWTVLMLVMLLINVIAAFLTRNKKKDDDEEDENANAQAA